MQLTVPSPSRPIRRTVDRVAYDPDADSARGTLRLIGGAVLFIAVMFATQHWTILATVTLIWGVVLVVFSFFFRFNKRVDAEQSTKANPATTTVTDH